MKKNPNQISLRSEYAAMTRVRIVTAFVELLEEEDINQIPMNILAKRANVAERTIFRHFPTRADLVAAAGEWINNNVFELIPFKLPEDLSAGFRQACVKFDRNPELAHTIAATRLGQSARSEFRKDFIASIRETLSQITDQLESNEVRQAEAVVAYLDNVLAWHSMRQEFAMSGGEIADAIEWVLSLVIDDLRQRNAAAEKRKGENAGSE